MNSRLPVIAVRSCLLGALFALLVVAGRNQGPVSASLDSYIYYGMATNVYCSDFQHDPVYYVYWIPGWASCWHKDEPGTDAYGSSANYTAIDYTGTSQTEGVLVQLWYTGYSITPYFRALPAGYNCTGLRVDTYRWGNYQGDLHYLHIDVYGGVIGSNYQYHNNQFGYFWRNLGTVSSSQPQNCGWTAPHLHQSANTAAWTPIYSNSGVNPTNTWQHRFSY